MYTQCTKCRTIFEIDEGALQASLGIVRCGHCSERFDALRTLSGDLPTGSDAMLPEHDPEQHAPTLTHAISTPPHGTATEEPDPDDARGIEYADAANLPAVPADSARPVPVRPPPLRALVAKPADLPSEAMLGNPDLLALVLPIQTTYVDGAIAVLPLAGGAAMHPTGAGQPAGPAGNAVESPSLPMLAEAESDAAAVAPEPIYVPPRRRVRRSTWLCASACLVLALTLVAQVAWARRAALVRDAATQSWALAVCARLDCRLPPIRDLAKLELVSRDVRADPRAAGTLTISAIVRNNAAFRQPWPVLVVELTDLDDEVVAMRRFVPADYVPDAARRRAGIGPGTTAAIAFEVADPGKHASGFHFGFE